MQVVILAGGSGTRFWPLSRRLHPKQLLQLEGGGSLLQQTYERVRPLVAPHEVWVSTASALAGQVAAQLPEVPPHQILCEPVARNTAPAIAWSVFSMPPWARGDVVAVLPADHRVADAEAFRVTLAAAAGAVREEGRVMTLGVTPTRAETGYGYLEMGSALDHEHGVREVVRFTEKPDAETAARFLASGTYLWNAGIFLFRGEHMLELIARLEPDISAALDELRSHPERLDAVYRTMPRISIDYAVMEQLDDLGTLPLDCGWSDLGSWEALAEVLPADAAGNVCRGDVVAVDAGSNLLFADQGQVAVLGVEGLVVVRTGDTVLVVPKERSQEVRRLVELLAESRRDELL